MKKNVNHRLKRERLTRQLSQSELGELALIHQTYVAHLESGDIQPSQRVARRLGAILNVEPAELFGEWTDGRRRLR